MPNITLIGPVAKDTIFKNNSKYKSTGGAVYYQSSILNSLKIKTKPIVTLSKIDNDLLNAFPENVEVFPLFYDKTIEFQNIYPTEDPNFRIQKASIPINPIKVEYISSLNLKDSDIILLGPLCPYDIPLKTLEYLFNLKIPIYLGIQGYLRHLKENKVVLHPCNDAQNYLKFIKIIFMDENEAEIILGKKLSLEKIAKKLTTYGPEEVIITQGSKGALIYSKALNKTYKIPAFPPKFVEDPTGLGDTFMAAYAAKKLEVNDPGECGRFAAAASAIKLENKGVFKGNKELIEEKIMISSKI
ncbi:PfkB family carbohydrate kinase [Methanobacterium oryzae]|uniref:PfkB family carbohydrate kinase n=1 Tax=Methanobacterium oryzae TaxID=69540 RepID=UPI003D1F2840